MPFRIAALLLLVTAAAFADAPAATPAAALVASRTAGTDVLYYATLHDAFEAAGGDSVNFPDEITLLADVTVNEPLIVEDGKHIVLTPGGGSRTIRRGNDLLEFPVIWVNGESSSLSLGKPGMEHELVIDGGCLNDPPIEAHAPLAAVSGHDAKMIMFDKVTLQNNINAGAPTGTSTYQNGAGVFIRTNDNLFDRQAEFIMKGGTIRGNTNNVQTPIPCGGGVMITGFGIFTMEGGIIMGNTAYRSGGGVNVGSRGSLNKTGGIIYGSDAPFGTRNIVIDGAGEPVTFGHAVFVALIDNPVSRFRDDTVLEDDFLSYAGSPTENGVFGEGEKWSVPRTFFWRNFLIIVSAVLAAGIPVFIIVRKKIQKKKLEKNPLKETLDAASLEMSPREKEVFDLLLTDLSIKQIAHTLQLTYQGVMFHSQKIYRKLGIQSRTELLVKFRKQ